MHALRRTAAFAVLLGSQLAGSIIHAQERFTLPGAEVTIHNLAGTLQVVAGSGSSAEVEITRVGRDAAQLRIERETSSSGSTLRVIYPADDIVYPRMGSGSQTSLSVSADGTFGRGSGERGRTVRITGRDRAEANAIEAAADMTIRVPAGVRVNAHVAVGEAQVRGVSAPVSVSTSSGDVTASNVRGDVTLRTASGRIDVDDVDGDVALRTASGGVKVGNVRGSAVSVQVASGRIDASRVSAPQVELRTSSGRIRAEEIRAERLTLRSSSGGVTGRALSAGEANVSTASGSIDVDFDGALRVAELRAASGSVTLRLPESLGATLELRSTSGGIRVHAPMTISSQRRGYTAGTIGDGSARISASSTSGGVTVSRR